MIGCTNDMLRSNFSAVCVWDTSVTSSRLLSKPAPAAPAAYQETLASSYRVFKVSSLSAKGIIPKVQNILLTIVFVFSMNANTLIPVHRWEK